MARLRIRCVDNRGYLREGADGRFFIGPVDGETTDLTLGKQYTVLAEDQDSYQIIDDTGEPYIYPKYMFEPVY
jgi:hypothetical protein